MVIREKGEMGKGSNGNKGAKGTKLLRTLYRCPSFSLRKNPTATNKKKAHHQAYFRLGGKPRVLTIPETHYNKAWRLADQLVKSEWEKWRAEYFVKPGGNGGLSLLQSEGGGGVNNSEVRVGVEKISEVGGGVASQVGRDEGLELAPLVSQWIDDTWPLKITKRSTRQQSIYQSNYAVKMVQAKVIGDLTSENLTKAKMRIRTAPEGKQHRSQSWGKFNSFLRWLKDMKYIHSMPLEDMRLKLIGTGKGRASTGLLWTEPEYQSVAGKLEFNDRVCIRMLWFTGMAPADLMTLEPKHIVRGSDGVLYIHKVREKAKSVKELIRLPLAGLAADANGLVRDALQRCKEEGRRYLFNVRNSERDTAVAALDTKLRDLLNSKFPEYVRKTLYNFRHTFATRAAKAGVPEHILERWMGHMPGSKMAHKYYVHIEETTEEMLMAAEVEKKKTVAFRAKGVKMA